jgi:hypothetical protein
VKQIAGNDGELRLKKYRPFNSLPKGQADIGLTLVKPLGRETVKAPVAKMNIGKVADAKLRRCSWHRREYNAMKEFFQGLDGKPSISRPPAGQNIGKRPSSAAFPCTSVI